MTAKITKLPTSEKQIDKDRSNAQRSTGPRSGAGKAIAGRNALQHGLCAAETPVLPDEDAGVFRQYHQRLMAELAPRGMLEAAMVERIANLQWRLARAGGIEAAIFAVEHARRAHLLAESRCSEADPGSMPDWDQVRRYPPRGGVQFEDDEEPHVLAAVETWNTQLATYKKARAKRDVAREQYRSMTGAKTFDHLMDQPKRLENLTRYEINLYRQLEAALRQYWMVAGVRPRPADDAPEILQSAPADDDTAAPNVNGEALSD